DHVGRDVERPANLQDEPAVLGAITAPGLSGSFPVSFVPGGREKQCGAGPPASLATSDLFCREEAEAAEFLAGAVPGLRVQLQGFVRVGDERHSLFADILE